MRAELPILSFFCLVVLIVILPLNLRRKSVANLAISGWLLVCNLIHAINSIVWAHNVAVQIPVWCDIGESNASEQKIILTIAHSVTKLLLASNIAIPAALICHFRELEGVSSNRHCNLSDRYKKLFEASLCILLPVIYICLRESYLVHPVVRC